MHNQLLKQIQQGVKLKTVRTNDRSKPMLEGLRKFRRQMTIEEQIQKAEEAPVDVDVIQDEMDDIDAVRDDLQSTKQMLAMELRNKEALDRDNKRLQVIRLSFDILPDIWYFGKNFSNNICSFLKSIAILFKQNKLLLLNKKKIEGLKNC